MSLSPSQSPNSSILHFTLSAPETSDFWHFLRHSCLYSLSCFLEHSSPNSPFFAQPSSLSLGFISLEWPCPAPHQLSHGGQTPTESCRLLSKMQISYFHSRAAESEDCCGVRGGVENSSALHLKVFHSIPWTS